MTKCPWHCFTHAEKGEHVALEICKRCLTLLRPTCGVTQQIRRAKADHHQGRRASAHAERADDTLGASSLINTAVATTAGWGLERGKAGRIAGRLGLESGRT